MKKALKKYRQWVKNNSIVDSWDHEDYDNTIVYEDINGDIVCIQRDNEGNIVDAWDY